MATRNYPRDRAKPRQSEKAVLKDHWGVNKKRGPFKRGQPDIKTKMSGRALSSALTELFDVTGDEAFRTAAKALTAYNLGNGGLRQAARRMIREASRTIEDRVAVLMTGASVKDAESAAAKYGVGLGQSFDTVVTNLRRARRRLESGDPVHQIPAGDTGRHLLVFIIPIHGPEGVPRRSLFGVDADAEGLARVPDSRDWRNAIAAGYAISLGYLDEDFWGSAGNLSPPEREESRRSTWKKLVRRNPSE
jgi:hypothetical protein